jgi:hypothetical protein
MMNTLILATALSFLNPAEGAAETTNCKSLERYAAVVMHARQTGTSQAEISSLVSTTPTSYQPELSSMINTAYKKPRFLYSGEEQLNSVNQFRTEIALQCFSK